MIIAGESSGEMYGAFLAGELLKRDPLIVIKGVGGQRMRSAGVDIISGFSASFGLVEALRTIGEIKKTFMAVVSCLREFKPHVLVLIDYPDFNLRCASEAKKLGIRTLYYVSPQVWAWRKGRVKTISSLADRMAVVLPFEEEVYKGSGLPCEFVGHPLLDEIREKVSGAGFRMEDIGSEALKARMRKELGLKPDGRLVVLMPGSRHHEVGRLLPFIKESARELRTRYPDLGFAVPIAPNLDGESLSLIKDAAADIQADITVDSIKTLLAADAATIASGTSTLQAAVLKVPMVVVYRLSAFTYFMGRLIIKVKYMSLANLLLESSVEGESGLRVKELLQDDVIAGNIFAEISRLLDDPEYRSAMLDQFDGIGRLFSDKNASARAADMVLELAGQDVTRPIG